MALWAWFIKLCGGFIPFNGEKIGKIIWVLVWVAVGLTVYHKVFYAKQQTTTIEKVERQYIYNDCPSKDKFFGVKLWKVQLGISL